MAGKVLNPFDVETKLVWRAVDDRSGRWRNDVDASSSSPSSLLSNFSILDAAAADDGKLLIGGKF